MRDDRGWPGSRGDLGALLERPGCLLGPVGTSEVKVTVGVLQRREGGGAGLGAEACLGPGASWCGPALGQALAGERTG